MTADLNGDGILDLAVANFGGYVSVLLGNGDGTFQQEVPYRTGDEDLTAIAVGDFNGDGILDLAVAAFFPPFVSILPGTGGGRFGSAVSFAGPGLGLAVADFNGDGGLDLASATEFTTITIFAGTPGISLSPSSLNFGNQTVFLVSPVQRITLTNTGTEPLILSSIAVSDQFVLSTLYRKACLAGESIAAGATCTITVAFKPTTKGAKAGILTVTDNASTTPQTVALSGTGTLVSLSPASLQFGTFMRGTSSPPQTITLTNRGSVALNVTTILFATGVPKDFSQTNNCIPTVAAKGTCTISVVFSPTVIGPTASALEVFDNGGGTPQLAAVAGTGQ